ncbi:unnamed protein product [Blepharisma stoltei]|uniref:Uncharacterized protein n=1 Tax=Blepharisma stoltei TaxID=1481888 RepID=A0AAU9JGQ0_9CILI|nr:unnamed protein product [Blepharisma stoltei]
MVESSYNSSSKIHKMIEYRTIYPLCVGLILASVIAIIILYSSEYHWVKDVKDYIIAQEINHLLRASIARGLIFGSLFSTNIAQLQLIRGVFDGSLSGTIKSNDNLADPNAVDARNPGNIDFNASGISDYVFSDTSRTLSSSTYYNQLKLLDILLNTVNPLYKGAILQLGLIMEQDHLDYRHPVQNMSYVQGSSFNFSDTCGKENVPFDPICTKTYYWLKNNPNRNATVSYEYSVIPTYLDTDFGASILVSHKDMIKDWMNPYEYYTYFITSNYGELVLALNQKDIDQIFSYNLSYNLFPDDYFLAQRAAPTLQAIINAKSTSSSVFDGLNSRYYVAVTNMNITLSTRKYPGYEDSFSAGVMISRAALFIDWYDTLDTIENTIIIQMVIFICFVFLTIIIAVRLSKSITHRVTYPLWQLEQYLLGKIKLIHTHIRFNRETNTIVKSLNLIEDIEKLIDPHYLLHPRIEERLQNLEIVEMIYTKIGNLRGIAITSNLIGNIFYDNGQYRKAIEKYKESLEITVKILEGVEEQEKEESELNEQERIKEGFVYSGWKAEKDFLIDDINNRKLQLCMAMRANLKVTTAPITDLRTEWKEVLNLQTSVLQHYIQTSSNFLQLIRLLIDMSISFQSLQYFHSAIEILNIVHDELEKLDQSSPEFIDIDIARLKRIGVNLQDSLTTTSSFFNVTDITYQKDVLKQFMYYRKGIIFKEQDKFQESAASFTLAIERGEYYDPEIRTLCIEELNRMMNKFSIKTGIDELKRMHHNIKYSKKSIVFILSYKINSNPKLNKKLIKFVNKEIGQKRDQFGVVCMNSKIKNILDVAPRDMPEVDLEHLLFQIAARADGEELDHIYDLIMCGFNCFPVDTLDKHIVAFVGPSDADVGASYLKDLEEITARKIQIIVIFIETLVDSDFRNFLENNDCKIFICDKISQLNEILEEVKSLLFGRSLI